MKILHKTRPDIAKRRTRFGVTMLLKPALIIEQRFETE